MRKGYAFLIVLAGILWGFDGLIRRYLVGIPPSTIVFYVYTIGFLILSPLLPRFIKEYKKMSKKDWIMIITIAVLSGAIANILFTAALAQVNYINYSVVILLQQIRPVFTILLAALVLKEKFNRRYFILAFVALFSAYFLTFPEFKPHLIGGNGELKAAFLALGAAAMWGSTIVLSKMILHKLSYLAAVTLRFAIVIPTAFIFSLLLGQTYPISAITSTQWGYLILIAFFSNVVSFVAYYKGLQKTEVKIATFAEFAWPVSAALIGFFVLKERLTLIQSIAAVVLIGDIIVLSLSRQEK